VGVGEGPTGGGMEKWEKGEWGHVLSPLN